MRDRLNRGMELSYCCDRCCGFFPDAIVNSNINKIIIECRNCGDSVEILGVSERAELAIMIEWNQRKRNST